LSFAEAGDPAGFPVLCFFGIGGSRYLVLLLDAVAREHGLRVISPDRPGFGRCVLTCVNVV
jgi:pimeloyl-ACP methyl ester carboxylesterase